MAKGQYQIPFDEDGNQLGGPWCVGEIEWRDNYEFDATLTYDGYGRGRSSVVTYRCDEDGHRYEMFMSNFDDMMRECGVDGRCVSGTWTFVKKGQNYGIRWVR